MAERRGSRGFARRAQLAAAFASMAALPACDLIEQYIGGGGPEVVEGANAKLVSGDIPGAASEFEALSGEYPDSIEVALGRAYTQLLAGDLKGADNTLAAAQAKAGDKAGEIELRRALVALRGKDLDNVKAHGAASGMPQGKLLAAEVHLVDLESDEASAILREIQGTPGAVGATAKTYLEMLESDNQHVAGLAEATALWALGERDSAVESAAEELVKALPGDMEGKSEQLLMWAGRAVTSGHAQIASNLLDDIDFPPEGQAWRVQATRAMVDIAEGDSDAGLKTFESLKEGGAPTDGLADALATACSLTSDTEVAKKLADGLESAAAARCLSKAGAEGAGAVAPTGPLKTWLENR